MPSDMRLQCPPCEDTPPSTRPPSVASSSATSSSSGLPQRSISTDSLHTTSSSDKPTGEEYIPTRLIRASPKANSNAMQFVKTGPAMLHKSAKEQMKKAEVVKSLRKTSLQEEEEWQSSSSTIAMAHSEEQDWQSNLDKWKSSRRKRNEDVLERVIEIKKSEQEEEFSKTRRKSKTFNEMREDKRGRRFNLVVHDDDNNDLSDLGLTSGQKTPSLSDPQEEPEMKFADQKSDAGFCTGSDTGSDGVFAEVEDNISDTSSALGDKREIHDSLLESGGSTTSSTTVQKDGLLNGHVNGHVNVNSSISVSTVSMRTRTNELYTYDKAIEDYKQFAENSAKKRTSSVTSLSSTASGSKDEEKPQQPTEKGIEPPFLRRERSSQMKIDLDKRRSMFELRDIDPKWSQQQNKINNRKSMDVGGRGSSTPSLRSKVASFEHLNELGGVRARGITPPRDTKFKEKLKNFSEKERERGAGGDVPPPRKKTPERDQNFYQKLQSFTRMETNSSQPASPPKMVATPPPKMVSAPLKPSSLKITPERGSRRTNAAPPTPLKDRIASFENLSPSPTEPSAPWRRRELSVSMENLHKSAPPSTNLSSAPSVPNLTRLNRRAPTTPFMVVEVDEITRPDEEACVKRNVSREYEVKVNKDEEKEKITGDSVGVSKQVTAQPFKESNVAQQRVPEIPSYTSELPVPKPQMLDAGKLDSRTTRTLPAVPQSSRSLPEVPVKSASSRKLPETPDSISRILPELPPKIPDMPPPALPESSTWVDVTECNGIEAPGEVSPPVPPPRVPIVEDPYSATPSYKDVNGMEEEGETIEYGDLDIDEVIDNYEHLSQAITIGDGGAFNETMSDKYETSRTNGNENYYEKILDDDPLYENIYEKVEDEINEEQALVNREAELVRKELDHHYQTLDEIHREKTALSSNPALLPAPVPAPSPSLPPKNKGLSVFEVLDVTWTEDVSSTPAAPPSVPPPPPPEEEEGPEIDEPTPKVAPPTVIPSPNPVDTEQTRPTKSGLGSPQSTKQDLRKKMSDFLGSKPQVEEELTMKPPPDVSEILRQERETERMIVQKQASLVRDSPLLDFDFSQPHGRAKYTWEDRMKADGPKPATVDLDESTDHLEFHTKLAELEQEMVKHDRDMLQRVKAPAVVDEYPFNQPQEPQTEKPPPTQYSGESVSNTSSESEPYLPEPGSIGNQKPQNVSNSATPTAPALPIQEFYTAPVFDKRIENSFSRRENFVQENSFESSVKTREAIRVERSEEAPPRVLPDVPPPIPRKQSILALSAIPKPRLTDNDSWIMKRKAEAGKKDYSKHWLIQEAEQRRLEQQERISRPTQLSLNKPPTTLQSTAGYQSHFQNIKSTFHSASTTSNQSPTYNHSAAVIPSTTSNISALTDPIPISPSASIASNIDSNKLIYNNGPSHAPPVQSPPNSSWKKQTKTYQPPQPSPPSSNKPLPDAIINTITQRVNNKNKINGSVRPTVYNSSNIRGDDNYHDYMNTDTFVPQANNNHNQIQNNNPVLNQAQQGQVLHSPQGNPPQGTPPQRQLSEDQRLLSVSGKKKCSHCGEELGRGAAMIIESLRLFYHIPCFKCCVCGIQLGNGTSGADVRVRNHKLHCHNCYSNDEGMKFSKV